MKRILIFGSVIAIAIAGSLFYFFHGMTSVPDGPRWVDHENFMGFTVYPNDFGQLEGQLYMLLDPDTFEIEMKLGRGMYFNDRGYLALNMLDRNPNDADRNDYIQFNDFDEEADKLEALWFEENKFQGKKSTFYRYHDNEE